MRGASWRNGHGRLLLWLTAAGPGPLCLHCCSGWRCCCWQWLIAAGCQWWWSVLRVPAELRVRNWWLLWALFDDPGFNHSLRRYAQRVVTEVVCLCAEVLGFYSPRLQLKHCSSRSRLEFYVCLDGKAAFASRNFAPPVEWAFTLPSKCLWLALFSSFLGLASLCLRDHCSEGEPKGTPCEIQ